mmetsp:Transcript_26696/g.43915  ORF Transcript_26696/g.43915 Transcript_26696/m.43915 type:complete len:125 (+) Transcript_26696:1472-1846(+)
MRAKDLPRPAALLNLLLNATTETNQVNSLARIRQISMKEGVRFGKKVGKPMVCFISLILEKTVQRSVMNTPNLFGRHLHCGTTLVGRSQVVQSEVGCSESQMLELSPFLQQTETLWMRPRQPFF